MSLRQYPNLKASLVNWLGLVPSHWQVGRIKLSVASCRNGIWGEEEQKDENDVICVRVADFDRIRFQVNLDNHTVRNIPGSDRVSRIICRGDLLLEKSGGGEKNPVGFVVQWDSDTIAVCSNFIARIQLNAGMHSRFWTYVHAAAYAVRLTTGSINQTSGIQNLDQGRYFNELVAYPPSSEQAAIAAFLDRETAKIDALVAEQERLIELLAEKRRAVISHAVTKGLDPNAPMKDSGIEWLGAVPAHWEVKPLKLLTDPERPIMYGIVLPGENVDVGVPIVKGGDVRPGRLIRDLLNKTTFEIEAPFARARLKFNDIVYSIRGSIGDAEIVPADLVDCNITQDAARISPKHDVVPDWLLFVMKSKPIFAQLEQRSLGATIKGINIFDLKRAIIPVPPPREQKQISDFIRSASDRLDQLKAEAERAIALLKERRAALISAAVTGKIDVRETASAEEVAA